MIPVLKFDACVIFPVQLLYSSSHFHVRNPFKKCYQVSSNRSCFVGICATSPVDFLLMFHRASLGASFGHDDGRCSWVDVAADAVEDVCRWVTMNGGGSTVDAVELMWLPMLLKLSVGGWRWTEVGQSDKSESQRESLSLLYHRTDRTDGSLSLLLAKYPWHCTGMSVMSFKVFAT